MPRMWTNHAQGEVKGSDEEDEPAASQAVDATHHRQVHDAFGDKGRVCNTLLHSMLSDRLYPEYEDFDDDYKDVEHLYCELMLHTVPVSGFRRNEHRMPFVNGRWMKWPKADPPKDYRMAPLAFVALGEALREVNKTVLESMLAACDAAPLLKLENAFAIVSLQSHWGTDTAEDAGSHHKHKDYLWRAVTASVTLKGTRVVHNELASICYNPGDGYFACPLASHHVEFTNPFNSKAAHFSFGVPADTWAATTRETVKKMQLKFLEVWPQYEGGLRFPTATEYWAALQKVTTSTTRQALNARTGSSKYFNAWPGANFKELRTGPTSIRKMAMSAECPAFDHCGMPLLQGASDFVKGLRLYRDMHRDQSDNNVHMGTFSDVSEVLRNALIEVQDKSIPWFYASADSKHFGSKTIFRSSEEDVGTWSCIERCPATTAFPTLHGGHYDPAHGTVAGAAIYKQRHEEGLGKRVLLPSPNDDAHAADASDEPPDPTPLELLRGIIYRAIDFGLVISKTAHSPIDHGLVISRTDDEFSPWKQALVKAYDFAVHCMACNTPPHTDNKWGDAPGMWVGVLCNEDTFFVFRNARTGQLVVIHLVEGDFIFFSGVLREHFEWSHLCLRDIPKPDTKPLFAPGKDPFPEDARLVLQARFGPSLRGENDVDIFEAPSSDDETAVHTTGCFACGAVVVCVDPMQCLEVSDVEEGIVRQDVSRPLLHEDGKGDQDRPFWRRTRAQKNPRTQKNQETLVEMATLDCDGTQDYLCVQHGPSIATIAHAMTTIDAEDLAFIDEDVYLDEKISASDFCRLLVASLPHRFRRWPASILLTDPQLNDVLCAIDLLRRPRDVARSATVKRGAPMEMVQMPYATFMVAWRALVTYLQQLSDATEWVSATAGGSGAGIGWVPPQDKEAFTAWTKRLMKPFDGPSTPPLKGEPQSGVCDGYAVKEALRLLRKKAHAHHDSFASTWLDALWPILVDLALGASAAARAAETFQMDSLIDDTASATFVDARWREYFTTARTYGELELAPGLLKEAHPKDLRTWDSNLNGALLVALANRGIIQGEYFDPTALARVCTTTGPEFQDMCRKIGRWLRVAPDVKVSSETATCVDTEEKAVPVHQGSGEEDNEEDVLNAPITMGGANPTMLCTPVWQNIKTMQVLEERALTSATNSDWDQIFKATKPGTTIPHMRTLEDLLTKVDSPVVYVCVCLCV